MAYKLSLLCVFALFQAINSQCLNGFNNGLYNRGLNNVGLNGVNGLNGGLGLANSALNGLNGLNGLGNGCATASTGGGFPVTSSSPNAPTGVSVVSENAYEGALAAGGNLPLLGTVSLEGVVPTAGAGSVSYGCGNGAVGITAEEGPIATGIAGYAGVGPAGIGPAGVGPAGIGPVGIGPAGPANYPGLAGFNGLNRFGLGANCGI